MTPGLKFVDANEYQSIIFYLRSCKLFGPFNNTFWGRYVPQISQGEPAVRHAVIALSAFQRGLGIEPLTGHDDVAQLYRKVALEHYGMSMQALRRRMAAPDENSIPVVLISCLFFTLLECLMGNYKTGALAHLRSGLDILGNLRTSRKRISDDENPTSDAEIVENQLFHIFAELELQAAFVVDGRKSDNLGDRRQRLQIPHAPPVRDFHDLSEAKYLLESVLSTIFDHRQWAMTIKYSPTPAQSKELHARYKSADEKLEQWSDAYSRYLSKYQKTFSRWDLRGATKLKFKQKFGRLMLESSLLLPQEMHQLWSEEESILRLIKSLADTLSTTRMQELTDGSPPPNTEFSPGADAVMPLSIIAMYSTDLKLRKQAVGLLSNFPRQEGFWNGVVLAKMATQALARDELASLPSPTSDDETFIPRGPRKIFVEDVPSEEGEERERLTLEIRSAGEWGESIRREQIKVFEEETCILEACAQHL